MDGKLAILCDLGHFIGHKLSQFQRADFAVFIEIGLAFQALQQGEGKETVSLMAFQRQLLIRRGGQNGAPGRAHEPGDSRFLAQIPAGSHGSSKQGRLNRGAGIAGVQDDQAFLGADLLQQVPQSLFIQAGFAQGLLVAVDGIGGDEMISAAQDDAMPRHMQRAIGKCSDRQLPITGDIDAQGIAARCSDAPKLAALMVEIV